MRKHKLIIALCTVLLGLGACSQNDDLPPVVTGDEVLINLSAGEQNLSVTRGAFETPVPVTVLVFKRTTAGTPADVTGVPYRTFKGLTNGANLAPANGVDKLSVLSGFTYDFYAFANPKNELLSGTMSVAHGTDLLVGSVLNKKVEKTDASVTVAFGDLPHLGSQVQFTAAPVIRPAVGDDNGGFTSGFIASFGVAKVSWSKLPTWGSLLLNNTLDSSIDPTDKTKSQKLETSTAYTAKFELTPAVTAGISPTFSVGDKGVILPFPIADAARGHNLIDMHFALLVNGGNTTFAAENVQVPAFAPAKSYKFTLELLAPDASLAGGKINLYLSIVDWNKTTWVSGMGGDGTDNQNIILIGTWNNVRWTTGMGGDGTSSNQILSVGGWQGVSWASEMGKE